jgi:hypothetical protein
MDDLRPTAARRARRPLLIVIAAASVGFGLGFVVDLIWPNTVYGFQLVAAAIAGALVLVAAALWRVLPSLLPAAIGGAVGIVAGMMVGLAAMASPPALAQGTVEVRIIEPEGVATGSAQCAVRPTDASPLLLTSESGEDLALPDGRRLSVNVTIAGYGPVGSLARADGLGIELIVHKALPDGSPTSTTMVADAGSALAMTGDARAGTLAFDGLVLAADSEQREAIDLAGSVVWSCPSEG